MNQTYVVVEYSGDLVAFVREVNAKIAVGYKPLGGITSAMYSGNITALNPYQKIPVTSLSTRPCS